MDLWQRPGSWAGRRLAAEKFRGEYGGVPHSLDPGAGRSVDSSESKLGFFLFRLMAPLDLITEFLLRVFWQTFGSLTAHIDRVSPVANFRNTAGLGVLPARMLSPTLLHLFRTERF